MAENDDDKYDPLKAMKRAMEELEHPVGPRRRDLLITIERAKVALAGSLGYWTERERHRD